LIRCGIREVNNVSRGCRGKELISGMGEEGNKNEGKSEWIIKWGIRVRKSEEGGCEMSEGWGSDCKVFEGGRD
jgi:hypothetical protein